MYTLDLSEEWSDTARDYWRRDGVDDRIELRLGEAKQSLRALNEEGLAGTTDLVFIDADKESYPEYLELGLPLLRPNGLLVFDNVLWNGYVADDAHQEQSTRAIRELNQLLAGDARVDICMLPISDGLTLARKL